MSTDGSFGTGSSSDAQQSLQSFWPRVMEEIRNLTVVSASVGHIASKEPVVGFRMSTGESVAAFSGWS